ncbi:uncharacterized protein LODBEIA_P50450 [Lodderomyces beijingensis]|uniref:Uncharacterized protein n=1 Tax=Lodderomyces beijingensis TaxID=1775926 RepID=A0ABP0ZUM4_9ASCO
MIYHQLQPREHRPTSTTLGSLLKRATSSSSQSESSSDYCSESPNASMCQKPVSDNALTIALSIVLPVVAIICVLGYFLYRNYRKDKKENLEHDPDFFETGEATALPDFPAMKDPFHNSNSARYPMQHINKSTSSHGGLNEKYNGYNVHTRHDPYLDNLVLPYQHETGSKLSLDDYARTLGDSQGYKTSNDPNSVVRAMADTAHVEKVLTHVSSKYPSTHASPIKSPSKKVEGKQYTNLPNESQPDLQFAPPEAISVLETSDDDIASPKFPRFDVKYENESDPAINKTIPQIVVENEKQFSSDDNSHEDEDEEEKTSHQFQKEKFPEDASKPMDNPAATEEDHDHDDHTREGDFTFSSYESTKQHQESAAPETRELPPRSKSPRISAFNLLKNDSDNEEEDDDMDNLSPNQQEEIKRMKSIYKVYFDNSYDRHGHGELQPDPNYPVPPHSMSNATRAQTNRDNRTSEGSSVYADGDQAAQYQQYQHQENQQAYYDQFNQQYQQQYGSPVDPHLYQQFQQQQYNHYFQTQQRKPPRPLPPLQNLRNPADLRKSTLQTFTDFVPNVKNQTVTSPPMGKTPFVPIENDDVWTSPIESPSVQSQASFPQQMHHHLHHQQHQQHHHQQHPHHHPHHHHQQQQQEYFPHQQQQVPPPQTKPVPSASQLARSSVVMLNPVTEITKSRKFKPAGSFPSNQNLHVQYGHGDLNGPENDLLPGNRKSDVRRMMNTNF